MAVKVRVIIQSGPDWIRLIMNDVIICEGPEVTAQDLKELFDDLGFHCRLQHGVFTNAKDDGGDDAFECVHEVK
jgi:hypothetical protein